MLFGLSFLLLGFLQISICILELDPILNQQLKQNQNLLNQSQYTLLSSLLQPGNQSTTNTTTPINPDATLKFLELAKKYHYPAEEHLVYTPDGYILTMHRIPFSYKNHWSPRPNPKVIYLQHGLTAASDSWILNTPEKNIAYRLADEGYDVWMLNFRGCGYSLNHTYLTTNDTAFWNFSFHEMGKYDIPSAINHILEETEKEDLYYVGHSMGTTAFLIAMSLHPELNAKIKLSVLMAPVAFMSHVTSPIRLLSPLIYFGVPDGLVESLSNNSTVGAFGLNNFDAAVGRIYVCGIQFQGACQSAMFLQFGFDAAQMNDTQLPVYVGHFPSTSSVYCFVHYAQLINSGRFCAYDYGPTQNMQRYGTLLAPKYDLSLVTVKVALYYGPNDWLATPDDTATLAPMLPNLIEHKRINFDQFNHIDFIIAIDIVDLIIEPLLKTLSSVD